jgi:hypothetical protein
MVDRNHSKLAVGYGKPPKHTQFKPGQSGNPKGRPRKSTTFDDDVETELRSAVIVLEGGKRRKMTKRRAIAKQHVNKAMGGDVRSTELLLNSRRQGRFDQQDNLGALLEEFREKNRRLVANRVAEEDASIDLANSTSSIRTAGEES